MAISTIGTASISGLGYGFKNRIINGAMQTIQVVWREWPDGRQESCLVTTPEYLAWVAEGNTPLPADEQLA